MTKSVYDGMACIIRVLLDNTDEEFYEKYLALPPEKNKQINEKLSQRFPEIIENGNPQQILAPYLSTEGLVEKMMEFVEESKKNKDMTALVRLVSKLDSALGPRVEMEKVDSDEIQGLNSNSEEQQVQLLPRCSSYWAHRSKDKISSNTLNNFMNYLYYIDTKKLYDETKCTVSHKILSAEYFTRAKKRGYLNVGLSPLSDETELQHVEMDTGVEYNMFEVVGVSNEGELIDNIIGILEKAEKEDIDILCFPEMLFTSTMREQVEYILQENVDDKKHYPVLIFCPTEWSGKSNVAVVLNEMGEQIISQSKQFPFPFKLGEETYLEGFERDYHIQVLHCDGIGRIGIMICKDALNRDYLQSFLNNLKITLLVVPSFSTGFHDFEANLRVCEAFDCNVVWTNTCSAASTSERNESDKIGFVLKAGKKTFIRNGMYCFERGKCIKSNGGTCAECLFSQKIYFGGKGCK